MRISTSQIHAQGLRAMQTQQVDIARTQQQLATGRRLLTPSDDPAAAARLLDVREEIETTRQYQDNIILARGRLHLEDSTLDAAGDILQRVRELTVQANNAPLDDVDRRAIAQEVRQLTDYLRDVANTKDGQGDYLFGGFRVGAEPFVADGDGAVVYRGDRGQRLLQVGASRQVAVGDDGAEVFMQVPNGLGSFQAEAGAGNTGSGVLTIAAAEDTAAIGPGEFEIRFTGAASFDVVRVHGGNEIPLATAQPYAPGQPIDVAGLKVVIDGAPAAGDSFTLGQTPHQGIFPALETLAAALERPLTGDPGAVEQFHQGMAAALESLDLGINHLSEVRGRVGARLNALDAQGEANAVFITRMETVARDIEAVDYAEAAVRLNEQLLGLQAAQQSFARIQGLSLFNYL